MSILDIRVLGDPILREETTPVETITDELRALARDMFDTMHVAKGIGLAAPQIGRPERLAVVEVDEHKLVIINPEVVHTEGKAKAEEGCLSIPDIYGDVQRAFTVIVEATDVDGTRRRIEGTGLLARAILHEIDHLDGILFTDRVGPIKRRLLLREWEKSRKGKSGYIREEASREGTAPVG